MFKLFYFLFFVNVFFLDVFKVEAKANNIKQNNFNKPIKIESDEIKILKNKSVILFTGKVKAKQDNLNIFSDKMFVNYQRDLDNKTNIKNIKAIGNVILKNENITAKGDEGLYDFVEQNITLSGNIILTEKDAVIFGDVLKYNINTEETSIKVDKKQNTDNSTINNKKKVVIILDNINDLKDRYDK